MNKNISYAVFENLVLHALDKMTPIKQKYITGNQSFLMALMTRARLKRL